MKNNKGSESSPDSCVKCYTMFLTTKTYPGGLLHDPSTFYTEKRRDSKHY